MSLAEQERRLLELDVLEDRWKKVQGAVRSMIEHAAAKEKVKADALIDAIIADREAKDAMP